MSPGTHAIVPPRRHEDTKTRTPVVSGFSRTAASPPNGGHYLLVFVFVVVSALGVVQAQQVTFDRLLHADREPQNWLTYSGSLFGHRYSPLTQITPGNVKNLELQWVFQTRGPAEPTEKSEATPLVVDGVMYTTLSPNHVVALDAATGRMFWMFSPRLSTLARVCCGRVNRGLAILGDTLFMGTIDGHLIAIDAKIGKPIWDVSVTKPELGYSLTVAPLVIRDKVIIGPAGGEYIQNIRPVAASSATT